MHGESDALKLPLQPQFILSTRKTDQLSMLKTYYATDLLTPFFRDPSLVASNEIFLYIALELLIIRKYTSDITWWTMVLSGLKQTSPSRFKKSTAPLQLFSTHA